MKIAVSGTQCIGKSTFAKDFLSNWSMYKKPDRTYRDIIREKNLPNMNGTEESQRIIRDAVADEVMNAKGKYILFDRCIWDNLVYTLWLNSKDRVSDKFVKESIDITRETLGFFDIIFFLPITQHSPVKIVKSEQREVDPNYRNEVDMLFKSLMGAYTKQSQVYYPFKSELGCPGIIEIFGTPTERIQLAKMYITENGEIYGEDETLLKVDKPLDEDGKLLAREVFGR